jgi:hypothetical protein
MNKPKLTIPKLIATTKAFCEIESTFSNEALYGVTDGKAVGTLIEQKFKEFLLQSYTVSIGNSAFGIDLPSEDILTDIKITSIKQPQSSCPFKSVRQKVFGLGYNLLVFVYDKKDDPVTKTAVLDFVSCSFIEKERTADYTMTLKLRELVESNPLVEEVKAFLMDANLPADEGLLEDLAIEITTNPPMQGYLTISPALQWRLQYGRVVRLNEDIQGITRIIHKL